MSQQSGADTPVLPTLRRRSVPLALSAGLLVGALVTALLVGGTKAQLATVSGDGAGNGVDGAAQTAAPGTGLPSTGPGGGPTRPGGGLQGAASTGAGPAQGTSGHGEPQKAFGIDCAKLQTPGIRGVTPTTIKIGVGLADLAALEPLYGDAVHFGPQDKIFDAVFKGAVAQGGLPCGRRIVPVYQKYQVLTESQSRAVCQSFINDDKVFAVITTFSFRDPLCVTQENKTFLIDEGYQIYQTQVTQSGGRLFSLHPPVDLWYRIWTNWVISRIKNQPGVKLGVYY
ncbi:MAG: branched-chain amino acid transport system substrate-binding protein, partial [Actinomycetota bacterium]|nr:branched-chain amino acid transport system substrate-binding protein [Actinomycetota bacterium]